MTDWDNIRCIPWPVKALDALLLHGSLLARALRPLARLSSTTRPIEILGMIFNFSLFSAHQVISVRVYKPI